MKDLKTIIDEVKSVSDENFKPSDDAILISATQILLNKKVSKPKANKPANKKFEIKDPTAPATDAQKNKLDELKVKFPEELTKGEASELIKEHLKKADAN